MYSDKEIPQEFKDDKDDTYEMYDFSKTKKKPSERTNCVNWKNELQTEGTICVSRETILPSEGLSGIFIGQRKNMEKLSPNRVQLFVRNKYTVFTMGGTVVLRSVQKKKNPESYSSWYVFYNRVYQM